MQPTTWWWILTGVLVVAELLTGTFYLLMLALGAAAGGAASATGLGLTASVTTAALVGGGATVIWHLRRARQLPAPDAQFALEVGHTVEVDAWAPNGSARVQYRGSNWTARPAHPDIPLRPGPHRIVRVDGAHLIIESL